MDGGGLQRVVDSQGLLAMVICVSAMDVWGGRLSLSGACGRLNRFWAKVCFVCQVGFRFFAYLSRYGLVFFMFLCRTLF